MNRRWTWTTTWITGASSGIGAALAREIAGPGRTLVLSGRSTDRLATVAAACTEAGARVEQLPFDLASSDDRRRAINTIESRGIRIDALINNAGISQRGLAVDTSLDVGRRLFEIDFFAEVELSRAVLPGMVDRGNGCLVAVSSIAALAGPPRRGFYNAAKAAQIRFFDTVRNELTGSGVIVSTTIVGMARTEISQNSVTADGGRYDRLEPNQAGGIPPEQVAREIIRGVSRGRAVFYTGMTIRSRIMVLLARWAPRLLDRILATGRAA